RIDFGSVAFNGQMWVLGGQIVNYSNQSRTFFNDVWSSSNGVTWAQATSGAPWNPRAGFGCVALNGQMWVLGGRTNSGFPPGPDQKDVWSPSDGVTWTQMASVAPWSGRAFFGAVVQNGRMWALPDSGSTDVWASSNGVSWTQLASSAPFAPAAFY